MTDLTPGIPLKPDPGYPETRGGTRSAETPSPVEGGSETVEDIGPTWLYVLGAISAVGFGFLIAWLA